MADQYPREVKESHAPTKPAEEEAQGCGVFDFLKKKETEKPHQEQEHHKPTLAEKLHHKSHDGDSSSSSSDEEGGEKKKKGLKGKIKDKIPGKKEDGEAYQASAPIEKPYDIESGGAPHGEVKKGFLEKIKDKLPGQHKEAEHGAHGEYHAMDGNGHAHETEKVEKKGILEKIKDRLPGGHKNEEEKAKEY